MRKILIVSLTFVFSHTYSQQRSQIPVTTLNNSVNSLSVDRVKVLESDVASLKKQVEDLKGALQMAVQYTKSIDNKTKSIEDKANFFSYRVDLNSSNVEDDFTSYIYTFDDTRFNTNPKAIIVANVVDPDNPVVIPVRPFISKKDGKWHLFIFKYVVKDEVKTIIKSCVECGDIPVPYPLAWTYKLDLKQTAVVLNVSVIM